MSRKHHDDCCCCCDMIDMPYPYEYDAYNANLIANPVVNPVAQGNYCNNGACGWNIWTIILAVIILQCTGILCNNRAFILLLLFWFCGGGCGGFGGCGCGNNYAAPVAAPMAAPMSMPCC